MHWFAGVSVWPLLFIYLLAALSAQEARSHGSVVAEEDSCVIKVGFYSAHFSVYQPLTRQHEEFCEDLPDVGESIFVLNYLHESMREVPVDFRIVRDKRELGRFARIEDFSEHELQADTVFYQPPQLQSDGVLYVLHPFSEPGGYVGIVTALNPNLDKTYVAVFPFEVGGNLTFLAVASGLGVLLVIAGVLVMVRRQRSMGALFLLLSVSFLAQPADARANTVASESGAIVATYVSTTGEVPLNRIHSWILELRNPSGVPVQNAAITVIGGMPEHDHGLQTAPRVTQDLGSGKYLLEGLRFHMNGHWQIVLSVTTADVEDTVVFELEL